MRSTLVLLAVLLCALCVWAQTPTGAIEGTVTDATGAVVPGAKVSITEVATGRTIPGTTSAEGRFAFRNLLPGQYDLTVESPGFAKKQVRGLDVNAGAIVNGSTALEVGRAGEVVEVTAEAVSVDTERQTVDSIVGEKEIKNLPLFGRNFLDLAALAPGTYIRDGGEIDPTKSVAYRTVGIAGRSGTGTRVQVDGIDVTDETVGTTVANFSNESVHEFQLTRSSLDPSTSLTSSGAVSIITKSGGNAIHGTGFWDYYNQDMGARLGYNEGAEPFHRSQTGFSAGGPFKKDKLFWFVDWERTWQTEQATSRVPEFPQLNVSQPFPLGIRYMDGRLDWNASSSLRIFGRFHNDWNLSTGGGAVSPYQNVDWTPIVSAGLDYTQAHTTHSYRFGYVNFHNRIESQELNYKFLRTPNDIPFWLSTGPFSAGPNSLAPQATYQHNWQNSYDGTWAIGKQMLRYGFSVTKIGLGGFANFAGPLQIWNTYDQDTIAQLKAQGLDITDPMNYPFESLTMGPPNGFFTLASGFGLPHGAHNNTRMAGFAQDSIKATRQLTVNVGVRWEYDTGYFNNNRNVVRDPVLERWIPGASKFPSMPKDLLSPSIGFAYDVTGRGKTVVRGGFYKAYEMNIYNNLMFDEFSMLPNGLGPDIYDQTYVTTPDGTPINVDGLHPAGDYSDLAGQPLKNVIGTIGQVQAALGSAYSNYKFDPHTGKPVFETSKGLTYGGMVPGNQFKIPYGLQFNIGIQHELKPGTVLQADYVYNHGVGLGFLLYDAEKRHDASTLNATNAQAQMADVLGGLTVDQWMAANPGGDVSSFGLMKDSIFQGLSSDYTRARFLTGGFTKYRALQVSLRGVQREPLFRMLKDVGYSVSYAYGRTESTAANSRVEFLNAVYDNHKPNRSEDFGPNNLDFTHMLTSALTMRVPGGFQIKSLWTFRTPGAQDLLVPNLGGATSGSSAYFATDLNGDGGYGTAPRQDLLPGAVAGAFGRGIKSFKQLNDIINAFNHQYAGKLTPAGQALVTAGLFSEAQLKQLGAVIPSIPLVPLSNPNPWHNFFVTDVRLDRPVKLSKLREGLEVAPFVDFYNLFNHSPAGLYGIVTSTTGLDGTFGSLNYDYANGGPGNGPSDLNLSRGRLGGANAPRKIQIGVRISF